jgi:hypothetical protein
MGWFCVLASHGEAVLGGCRANGMAFLTVVETLLHVFVFHRITSFVVDENPA